jgi:hypothetical protein
VCAHAGPTPSLAHVGRLNQACREVTGRSLPEAPVTPGAVMVRAVDREASRAGRPVPGVNRHPRRDRPVGRTADAGAWRSPGPGRNPGRRSLAGPPSGSDDGHRRDRPRPPRRPGDVAPVSGGALRAQPIEPSVLLVAVFVLLLAAGVAASLPSRRASRPDPMRPASGLSYLLEARAAVNVPSSRSGVRPTDAGDPPCCPHHPDRRPPPEPILFPCTSTGDAIPYL